MEGSGSFLQPIGIQALMLGGIIKLHHFIPSGIKTKHLKAKGVATVSRLGKGGVFFYTQVLPNY